LLLRLAAVTAANDKPDHERDDGREGKDRPDANSGCGASSCQTTPAFRSTARDCRVFDAECQLHWTAALDKQ
jgi:hypothetical protein